MEQATYEAEKDNNYVKELAKRRAIIAHQFQSIPTYGSAEFWSRIEESQLELVLPMEVLVKCVRVAITREDNAGKNRIFEMIFRRIQNTNENWSRHALGRTNLTYEEQSFYAHDLYADLCECVIRAILDSKRQFWEENFLHCLSFERKHVFQALLTREGRWLAQSPNDSNTRRIPRLLLDSLDQPVRYADGETGEMEIVDEKAQQAFVSVEQRDLPLLILDLPEKLKSVIWLLFWEGRTEKNVAHILGISDRTVRNRLQKALLLLRTGVELERKATYG